MRHVETISGMEGIKENDGDSHSNMIYFIHCKNSCKFHNLPPARKKKYVEKNGLEVRLKWWSICLASAKS
jgi:hypothetical protein